MNLPTTQKSPNGTLTFAQIDGPDDIWFWAIVTEYTGCQDYGAILMGFEQEYEPDTETVKKLLAALE